MKIYVSKYLKRLKCLNKYLPTIIWVKTSWTWSRPIGREPCGCIWQSWSITSWLANSKSGKMILPLFEFYHFKCGRIHSKVSGTGIYQFHLTRLPYNIGLYCMSRKYWPVQKYWIELFYPIEFMWPKIILLCKLIIFNLKYRNSKKWCKPYFLMQIH